MNKIMALDIGTKRIGIALSDYLHIIANGHSYVSRTPEQDAINEIKKIAKDNNVQEIVIGVPYNMDGTKGFQADDCIEFSKNFEEFDIKQEDERLTSDTADNFNAEIFLLIAGIKSSSAYSSDSCRAWSAS